MKKLFLLISFVLIFLQLSYAQKQPYRVVFDMTSRDTIDHKLVIRWLREISTTNPDAKLEVVFYGKSLDMITNGKSRVANDIKDLSANKNISFNVCAVALKNNNIDKSQVLPEVGIVPDGIYEIISKEGQGWGYIKVSH